MRPEAPELHLSPTTLVDEQTPPATPLSLELRIRAAIAGPMRELRKEFSEQIDALEGKLCEALVDSVSQRFTTIEQRCEKLEKESDLANSRIASLERWRDTIPSPPPSGAE